MMNKLLNERGFMLLNVVFLTLITSLAAMILLNAAPRVKNPHTVLRLTAIHLANEQFAMLESLAAMDALPDGSYSFLGDEEDLTTENFSESVPIKFNIMSTVSGNKVAVTVSWKLGEENFEFEEERTVIR